MSALVAGRVRRAPPLGSGTLMRALPLAAAIVALAWLGGCTSTRRAADAARASPRPDARVVADRAAGAIQDRRAASADGLRAAGSDDFYRALRLRGGHGGSVGKGKIGLQRGK